MSVSSLGRLAGVLAWLLLTSNAFAAPPLPGVASPAPPAPPAPAAPTSPTPSRDEAPAAPAGPEKTPAPTAADGDVERHIALGHRLFALARYEEAVAEFRRAYELRADPRFLYHIAEGYRELGSKDQAVFYYDRYLMGAPKASDRDEVEQKIADLGGIPGRAIRPRPRLLMEPPEEAPVERRPTAWRRWWFWAAVGAIVAAGVTAAVLAGDGDDGPPATELGSMRFF